MSEIKKCPECGGEMEKGYVNTVRHVFWDTKVHKGAFATAGGEKIIPLSWGFRILKVTAV